MFLPFSTAAKAIEEKAIALKQRLGVGWYDAIDPVAVLARIPARLLLEADVCALDPSAGARLFDRDSDEWSAFALPPADGRMAIIVLNSRHAPTRRRASLMEEVVHLMLGHPPSALLEDEMVESIRSRTVDTRIEQEAYDVGAACLLPYRPLFFAIKKGVPLAGIAAQFAVSEALVEFRVKRCALSRLHRKHTG